MNPLTLFLDMVAVAAGLIVNGVVLGGLALGGLWVLGIAGDTKSADGSQKEL